MREIQGVMLIFQIFLFVLRSSFLVALQMLVHAPNIFLHIFVHIFVVKIVVLKCLLRARPSWPLTNVPRYFTCVYSVPSSVQTR